MEYNKTLLKFIYSDGSFTLQNRKLYDKTDSKLVNIKFIEQPEPEIILSDNEKILFIKWLKFIIDKH
jgi:hypothetical protein